MSEYVNQSDTVLQQTFVMHGCREVLTLTAGAAMFERQMSLLEQSVYANPALAFDAARALIETVCKTILIDRGEKPDESGKIHVLLRQTTDQLQLLPSGQTDTRLTEAFKDTVDAIVNVATGLGKIRNMAGFVSHGKDAYDLGLHDATPAQFVARAADAIVHLLYTIHHGNTSALVRQPPLSYIDNEDFNTYVDDINPISIFGLPYRASEMLFNTDQEAYRDKLAEFRSGATDDGLNSASDE